MPSRKLSSVHRLDGVGGVDHLADLRREIEERCDPRPVASAGLANRQVVVPFGLELTEAQFDLVCRAGLINPLQVGRSLGPALPGHLVQAVPNHVHDAQLHAGVREHHPRWPRPSTQAAKTSCTPRLRA